MERHSSQAVQIAAPTCRNHPDRRARYLCQKFGERYCEECARCPRPTHCKFRTQCLIRALDSEDD